MSVSSFSSSVAGAERNILDDCYCMISEIVGNTSTSEKVEGQLSASGA